MRGYVERLEEIEYFLLEDEEATYEDVIDSYYDDVEEN